MVNDKWLQNRLLDTDWRRGEEEQVGRERENEGRMVKIGSKEQTREDREGIRSGWPEVRLRHKVEMDGWGKANVFDLRERQCLRDAFVAVRFSREWEPSGCSG